MDDGPIYSQPETMKSYARDEPVTTPDREPEVRYASERLRLGLESLHAVTSGLGERLHDLLGPERPTADENKPSEIRMTVLGGDLHEMADGFAYVERRLQDMLDRLRDGI